MDYLMVILRFKLLLIIKLFINGTLGSIDGTFHPFKKVALKPGEDPCNPLYWYPREIPAYCYIKTTPRPDFFMSMPLPMPIPVPAPAPMIAPVMPPPAPLPFGIPLALSNPMIPVAGVPYPPVPYPYPPPIFPGIPPPVFPPAFPPYPRPYSPQPLGIIPGLPGLVSPDGGINVLPFSDVYSDMLEKHKRKMIRKRLQKLLDEYDRYPYKSHKDIY